MGTHLAASDPVIVVVLRQLVDLLERERGAHPAQVRRDVKALQAEECLSKGCIWLYQGRQTSSAETAAAMFIACYA